MNVFILVWSQYFLSFYNFTSYILLPHWIMLTHNTVVQAPNGHSLRSRRCISVAVAVACHQMPLMFANHLVFHLILCSLFFSFACALWYFGLFSLPATHNSCGGELYFSQLESSRPRSSAAFSSLSISIPVWSGTEWAHVSHECLCG